ncbi:DUF3025 domain-containing protein [Dokdonella sp.]|uniref:DUF3025 domain-containing protein n=1 Tax=Dokdonella sp. TaxID=2291710 RepID=UPI00352865A7
MRSIAPAIDKVDREVFARQPLADWACELPDRIWPDDWPSLEQLDALRLGATQADGHGRPVFVAQTPALLADGQHYEERIRLGRLATRERNWHDLLNALVWLRYPRIKKALNTAQCADIAVVGPSQRTRAQYAMTHFDEGGAIVLCSDRDLMAMWDRHDWHGLFWRERAAWGTRITVLVFGHAVLELALQPERLLVAKSLALMTDAASMASIRVDPESMRSRLDEHVAGLIADGRAMADPQDLRPLPLSGIPGWHAQAVDETFFASAPCFRPLREGRRYPPAEEF